jgi:hypothetical protein
VPSPWRAAASRYSDGQLRLILEFQQQMEQIMRDRVARLRGGPAAEDDSTGRAGG